MVIGLLGSIGSLGYLGPGGKGFAFHPVRFRYGTGGINLSGLFSHHLVIKSISNWSLSHY